MIQTTNQSRRDTAVGDSKQTRRGMIDAMQALEASLGRATPSRETQWRTAVLNALSTLENAMQAQATELAGDDGLLADIQLENPRLSPRITTLRETYNDLVMQMRSLCQEFSSVQSAEIAPNIADVRKRLATFVSRLREYQSAETDLIFEATQVDIGIGD